MLNRTIFGALVLGGGLVLVGCGSEAADDGSDEVTSEAEGEIRASSVASFELRQSSGLMPQFSWRCAGLGTKYSFDLKTRKLVADLCRGGHPATISTTASKADAAKIKSTLGKIVSAPRPDSCPTDAPVRSLTVVRAGGTSEYVEARSACGGGTPVAAKGLQDLLDVVGLISSGAEEP